MIVGACETMDFVISLSTIFLLIFFFYRSPKQRELLLKAEIFGSFYPNFFVMDLRQQDDHFTLWGPAFLVEGSGLHAIMATSARSRQEIL